MHNAHTIFFWRCSNKYHVFGHVPWWNHGILGDMHRSTMVLNHCTMIQPQHFCKGVIKEQLRANLLQRCWFIQCVCLGCRNHIVAAGHTCVLCDTREFSSASDVSSLMMQEPRFEAALAIHLFKGGRLLLGDTSPGLSKMHAYVGFTVLVRASHRCNWFYTEVEHLRA